VKNTEKLGIATHVCNPSTWEAEAGGSRVPASLGYIVRHCLKNKNKQTNKINK
jgi:hypothetical protein